MWRGARKRTNSMRRCNRRSPNLTSRLVQRQAFAGMLWCKQFYGYDIRRWLQGDPLQPAPPPERSADATQTGGHLTLGDIDSLASGDIMSMPDSWEYPWFAAWDLAFHCVTFALIDPAFAKAQLVLLTQARASASQWPDARLRMEFQRRQSADSGLGGAADLRDRPQEFGRRRHSCFWSASFIS